MTPGLSIRTLLPVLLLFWAGACASQPAEWWSKSTNGFRSAANLARTPGSAIARELLQGPAREDQKAAAEAVRAAARAAFKDKDARIVTVAHDGRVLFEDSAWHVSGLATPLGFSMSKSLTGMAVGRALCLGRLQSLDDTLGKYVPQLAETSWGRSTIRQVLTMTSGAVWTTPRGWRDAAASRQHEDTYSGQMSADYLDLMRASDEKASDPGRTFRYSNYDTIALALLVEEATGSSFPEFFAREVWARAGTQGDGAWLRTRNGQTAAYVGFSANSADWLRLAFHVLDTLEEDSCFGEYMREATKHQVSADFFSHAYGYQVWVNCASGTDAFCFYGFGGQLLIMSPKKRLVLYAHSVSSTHSVDWYWREAFSSAWAKLPDHTPN